MIELIEKLSETPLPTILVIAGLLFLFIGLGGRFTANVVTDKVNVKLAAFVGAVLLLMGIIINIAPLALTKSPDDNTNSSDKEPPITGTEITPDIPKPTTKIVVGQSMRFKQGAMTCHNLDSITKYYLSVESDNKQNIKQLVGTGWCGYSVLPRLDVVVLDVEDQFVKVEGTHRGQTSIVWIKDEDLIK